MSVRLIARRLICALCWAVVGYGLLVSFSLVFVPFVAANPDAPGPAFAMAGIILVLCLIELMLVIKFVQPRLERLWRGDQTSNSTR